MNETNKGMIITYYHYDRLRSLPFRLYKEKSSRNVSS